MKAGVVLFSGMSGRIGPEWDSRGEGHLTKTRGCSSSGIGTAELGINATGPSGLWVIYLRSRAVGTPAPDRCDEQNAIEMEA